MKNVKYIVIHCSFTPQGRDVKASEIKRWHIEENGWKNVGYHNIIEIDGNVVKGRSISEKGAGVLNHNHHSIHICYVGGMSLDGKPQDTRTLAQKETLLLLLIFYKDLFPNAKILGHRDLAIRDCPSFDALKEYKFL